ncbi:cerebellin-3 [Biomphalaria glabrata]|uniref:Cerebellin-1-like n=1 Tax=Biomphalaria glabrata TaxID=6526 RepID=A0A9W2YXD6_BIOGL|nr:cerebellin-1-like [Biomphalaria glabrata]KAI8779658.1 cerebellin-3 [Biomphalaria glabrata]
MNFITTVLVLSLRVTNTKSVAVGFSSLLNLERPIATGERIIFDKVLTNVGNGYDPKSGNFTCPIRGLYSFSVGVLPMPNNLVIVDIYQNKNYLISVHGNDNAVFTSASRTVVIKCNKGDKIYLVNNRAPYQIYATLDLTYQHNIFSGFLISPML